MHEFQPLIDEHKDIYEIINKFKTALESTNKFTVMDELRNFKKGLDRVLDSHFATEERILFQKIEGKVTNEPDLIKNVLDEHKDIYKKKILLDELFDKYEIKHTDIGYEALIQLASDLADTLYNHAYVEDMTIFAFAGIVLSDEEKQIIAKELAKTSKKTKSK
ncbi:MAG: hemerythrin domain-containing protein [Candidatus Gastranaerophilales bacterium]|nr:hemerythrin domain-containing protein [Candidatus Gastranaerophilales bacterium]